MITKNFSTGLMASLILSSLIFLKINYSNNYLVDIILVIALLLSAECVLGFILSSPFMVVSMIKKSKGKIQNTIKRFRVKSLKTNFSSFAHILFTAMLIVAGLISPSNGVDDSINKTPLEMLEIAGLMLLVAIISYLLFILIEKIQYLKIKK